MVSDTDDLNPQIKEALTAFDERVKALETENKNLHRELRQLKSKNLYQTTSKSNDSSITERGLVFDGSMSDGEKGCLSEDTFSLMKVYPVGSVSWCFSMLVYAIQALLLIMIFVSQYHSSEESTPFDVPFAVEWPVRLGQILAILVTVSLSQDVLMPIKELSTLWFTNRIEWSKVTGSQTYGFTTWAVRIVIPNTLQMMIGTLALLVSFIIIIQSEDVIELFADFAAMSLIAELDNVAFWFAKNGYAGSRVMKDTAKIDEIEINDLAMTTCLGISLRPFLFMGLLGIMLLGFMPVIIGQSSGAYFKLKYPNCIVSPEQIGNFGNDQCDGGFLNSFACDFDGGDCSDYNLAYPTCNALIPKKVADGTCDEENDIEECGYDGGDCCQAKGSDYLGDGICHAGMFNSPRCLFDSGDCDQIRQEYSDCPFDFFDVVTDDDGKPIEIGNGKCDQGKHNIKAYMNEECGWVFGDCKDLGDKHKELKEFYTDCDSSLEFFRIGDGVCDGGAYLTKDCGWEKFDCCDLDENKIGDGVCDGNDKSAYLTKECGYESYDCCEHMFYLDNGVCQDAIADFANNVFLDYPDVTYNAQCGFDGNDCIVKGYPDCQVEYPLYIGDGTCNGGDYNKEECGWDGGDCETYNTEYPNCNPESIATIGDGKCNNFEIQNSIQCGFDGGDCILFNARFPNCKVAPRQAYKVGDGYCHPTYNIEECDFDGGDCNKPTTEFNIKYPYCDSSDPTMVGNGVCQGRYNTQQCGWDGGDCVLINREIYAKYPNCLIGEEDPKFLGDGECQNVFNNDECGWDDGDCVEFNTKYPNCKVNKPSAIGNGECNMDFPTNSYNIEDCGWDGGDCLIDNYPRCHVVNPRLIGDGNCDGGEYNTKRCGFDGGDC
jgi:hypothetical protein